MPSASSSSGCSSSKPSSPAASRLMSIGVRLLVGRLGRNSRTADRFMTICKMESKSHYQYLSCLASAMPTNMCLGMAYAFLFLGARPGLQDVGAM